MISGSKSTISQTPSLYRPEGNAHSFRPVVRPLHGVVPKDVHDAVGQRLRQCLGRRKFGRADGLDVRSLRVPHLLPSVRMEGVEPSFPSYQLGVITLILHASGPPPGNRTLICWLRAGYSSR